MPSFDDIANPWVGDLATYEPGRPIEEVARELGLGEAESIVKLASNENALGPSPKALAAMTSAAGEMHRYPDGGTFYLRTALAERLNVAPKQVLPANGSNELIELVGHAFLSDGDDVVISDTAFIVYRLVAQAFRCSATTVPMRGFTHDLEAMAEAIGAATKVIFVSNPNNPTGTMVGQDEIDRFMSGVPEHVVVCFDEAYIELIRPELRPDTLRYVREGRNAVVLRTFSKTYGLAGLRIGYAVASEACIRLLNRVRQPFNVNAMAQAAALAALDDEDHVRRTRELVTDGLHYLTGEFENMGLPYVPSVANFILVQVGRGREAFEAMRRRGVIVRPVDCYGLPDHVRITVGTQAENERCVAELERVLSSRNG